MLTIKVVYFNSNCYKIKSILKKNKKYGFSFMTLKVVLLFVLIVSKFLIKAEYFHIIVKYCPLNIC